MTTTGTTRPTTHQATIRAPEGLPVLEVVREFDAPVEAVFRAHTDPALVARWMGPRSVTVHLDHWDGVTGGSYRYHVTHEGGEEHFYGAFHEVRPSERLVQTFTWTGFPDGVSLDTHYFEDLGDGRTRLRVVSVVETVEGRDTMLASGMETGVREGYEKLDEILAASSSTQAGDSTTS